MINDRDKMYTILIQYTNHDIEVLLVALLLLSAFLFRVIFFEAERLISIFLKVAIQKTVNYQFLKVKIFLNC